MRDRLAEKITNQIGSWPFVILQTVFLFVYILLNTWVLTNPFDPFPFVFLNLTLSFQAAYTGPIVLMAQNASAKRDKERQERDAQMIRAMMHLLESQQKILKHLAKEVDETQEMLRKE
jgi:uncharacterized membrane protein